MKADYALYQAEALNLKEYNSQIDSLMKPGSHIFVDFYDELQILAGWWVSDGVTMKNTCWLLNYKDASGNVISPRGNYPTESNIMAMSTKYKSLREYEEKLNWAKICDTESRLLYQDIKTIEIFLDTLNINSSRWLVKQLNDQLFMIYGDNLGINSNLPCAGEWRYNKAKNELTAFEEQSSRLQDLVADRISYRDKKLQSNIRPPLHILPQWDICEYYDGYLPYYLQNSGVSFQSPFDLQFGKYSIVVQDLFKQYPGIKLYWETLEYLGFNDILYTKTEFNSLYTTPVKDHIIIEVRP